MYYPIVKDAVEKMCLAYFNALYINSLSLCFRRFSVVRLFT